MLLVEVSEGVHPDPIVQGLQSGAIELRDVATDTALSLTPLEPLEHLYRERLGFSLETAPAAGSEMLLSFAPETLTDFFLNRPTAPIEISFVWPAENGPVYDAQPPEVVEVAYSASVLAVTFSELVDPAVAAPTIQVAGMVTEWVVSASDPYQLVSAAPVPPGTHPLVITTDLTDLSGAELAEPFTLTLVVSQDQAPQIAFRDPDPRRVPTSAVGNLIGYHGLDRDLVTGFIYMRNRYYDPDMGRFITPDPLGYVDGPSQYAFAKNSPVVFGDPLGLLIMTGEQELATLREILANVGHEDLGHTLSINSAGFVGMRAGDIRRWSVAAQQSPTVALLLGAINDTRIEIDLRYTQDPALQDYAGASTNTWRSGDRTFPKVKSKIRLNPELIESSAWRVSLDTWAPFRLDAAVVHELGHAWGFLALDLASAIRLGMEEGPTDQFAVDREDEYREARGLIRRGEHTVTAVACPGVAWDSDLCRRKRYCQAHQMKTSESYCLQKWEEFKRSGGTSLPVVPDGDVRVPNN